MLLINSEYRSNFVFGAKHVDNTSKSSIVLLVLSTYWTFHWEVETFCKIL